MRLVALWAMHFEIAEAQPATAKDFNLRSVFRKWVMLISSTVLPECWRVNLNS